MFRHLSSFLLLMCVAFLSSCGYAKEDTRAGRSEKDTPRGTPTEQQPDPADSGLTQSQKITKARADCLTLVNALKLYALEHDGQYPPASDWSQLTTLAKNPPLDPWNRPYQWYLVSKATPDGTDILLPVVWSTGPQGLYGPNGGCSSESTGNP